MLFTTLAIGISSYVLFMIGVMRTEDAKFEKTESETNATEDVLLDEDSEKKSHSVNLDKSEKSATKPIVHS